MEAICFVSCLMIGFPPLLSVQDVAPSKRLKNKNVQIISLLFKWKMISCWCHQDKTIKVFN